MNKQLTHTHWQIPPEGSQNIQGFDDIHQCIHNILATRKGTDILRPQFGSDHFDYIDMPEDVAVPQFVRSITDALNFWELRIVIEAVYISGDAPHLFSEIHWYVKEDVEKEIYQTMVPLR